MGFVFCALGSGMEERGGRWTSELLAWTRRWAEMFFTDLQMPQREQIEAVGEGRAKDDFSFIMLHWSSISKPFIEKLVYFTKTPKL